jgi:hypothetical protein
MQWKHYWCYPCILEQKASVSSHYFLKPVILKSQEWNYTTAVYLLTNRYQGLFPLQKRTRDMKLVLKSWMCGALSPNTPHTFTAWCFITTRIDFTLLHNKSHFFLKRKRYRYLYPKPSPNMAPEHILNIYNSALNKDLVHVAEMARCYVPPIREQLQNCLKHFKSFTGTQNLLTGNRRSKMSMTHTLSFVH